MIRKSSILIGAVLIAAASYSVFLDSGSNYPLEVDSDKNGSISFIQWSEFHIENVDSDLNSIISQTEWDKFYFREMDRNKDDHITLHEWLKFHYASIDRDGSGFIVLTEWNEFHSLVPRFYAGYDEDGYIEKGSEKYYDREFGRVDCNRDLKMDEYEYSELRWNMRWCTSRARPERPWWK